MKMENQFWFLEYDDIDFDRYYTDDEILVQITKGGN